MGDMADWVNDDTPPGPEPTEPTGRDAFTEGIERLRRQVATAYERVPCPACGAQPGQHCHSLGRGPGRPLKHSHSERLRADGIPDR